MTRSLRALAWACAGAGILVGGAFALGLGLVGLRLASGATAASPGLQQAAQLLAPGGTATVEEHTRRITIAADGGAAQLVDVVRRLGEAAIKLDDIALRRPTLDDVFLTLTGHAAEELPVEEEEAA